MRHGSVVFWSTVIFAIGLFSTSCSTTPKPTSQAQAAAETQPEPAQVATAQEPPQPVEPPRRYGIDITDLDVHEHKLKRGQSLAALLRARGFSAAESFKIADAAKAVFSVRRMKSGNPYTFLAPKSGERPHYLIYEDSAESYVVFDLRDPFQAYREQREVQMVSHQISGTIEDHLYGAIKDSGAPVAVAIKLMDALDWTIDFSRVQPGDSFKAIFDLRYVDGEISGVGELQALYFNHKGRGFYGFQYGEEGNYYDENGTGLKRPFLKAPVQYSRISSRYSKRRFHPVQRRYKAHLGTDYAAPTGTPIRAVGDGVITEARYKKYNGRYVKIRHNGTYSTQYLHMSRIKRGIRPGTTVKQGQIIGYVGSTGLASGPHVCFRMWKNGRQVDHLRENLPTKEMVPETQIESFLAHRNHLQSKLEGMPRNDGAPRP